MKDSDNPYPHAFDWPDIKWVVRVRHVDTGEVVALNYFKTHASAKRGQEDMVQLYRSKRVCVSLFNRVPLTEV